MISLRIEFLAGRFHANPWDRGTNEGEIDWPPAPWRILRAITAGWYRLGQPNRDVFNHVLDVLADPPVYYLPKATAGHSRHYVPLGNLKGGKPAKTLMLDSFLALEQGKESLATAYVVWPNLSLAPGERALLECACATIGYLGRAESWCAVSVVEAPVEDDAVAVVDLASRRTGAGPLSRRLAAGPELRGVELLRSLSKTTGEMRRSRRLVPKGAVWLEYRLPHDLLLVREQYDAREREAVAFGPTIMRFAVERTASSILPPITDAVSVAEVMRRAAMARYSAVNGGAATTRLAGKSEDGSAKREGHDHPFYLPADSSGSGKIDTLYVWFPRGCTHAEYRAVASIDVLKDRFAFDGQLAVTFISNVQPPRGREWSTATPVVLDRFPKVRGTDGSRRVVDSPEHQLRVMIERRVGELCEVELWPLTRTVARRDSHGVRLDAFRRARRGERPTHPVAGATLRFGREIEGPVVAGRLAHFGLGRFEPA